MPTNHLGKMPADSSRKEQIEKLVAKGWNFEQIAQHLGCTPEGARYHINGRGARVQRHTACGRCGAVITSLPIHHPRDKSALCLACLRNEPDPTFGQRLKAYRLAAGLSLEEVSRRTAAPKKSLLAYERGIDTPGTWRSVALLAKVLGIGLLTDPPPERDPTER